MELWEEEKKISDLYGVPMRIKQLVEEFFDEEIINLLSNIREEELCGT